MGVNVSPILWRGVKGRGRLWGRGEDLDRASDGRIETNAVNDLTDAYAGRGVATRRDCERIRAAVAIGWSSV